MRYYNVTKSYEMVVMGDEPIFYDDNTGDTRELKIDCLRFFYHSTIKRNKTDTIRMSQGANDWYTARCDKTLMGYTTFTNVTPVRSVSAPITPSIISGSYDYDGETERFEIPLLTPIYSNDNITCHMSGKSSTKNNLSIDPNKGTISITREV